MKKFVSIALAAVLTLSLAVVAFAALPNTGLEEKFDADATITNVFGDALDYGAKVEWVDGTFTFGATQNYKYDAATQSWVKNGELASPTWGGQASVTITNYSNAAIEYTVTGSDNLVAITNDEGTLDAVTIANAVGAKASVTPSVTAVITPANGLDAIEEDVADWVTVTVALEAAAQ